MSSRLFLSMYGTKGGPRDQRGKEEARESKEGIVEVEFNLFLIVLFKRYNHLMGSRILSKVNELIEKTEDEDVKDELQTKADEFAYDVFPAPNAEKSTTSSIDSAYKKYMLESKHEPKG